MKEKKTNGSILQKLMLFAVLLCVVLIGLVWLLNVQLLEPMYHYKIRKDLKITAAAYAALVEEYGTLEDPLSENGIRLDFYEAVNSLPNGEALLNGKCIEISNAVGKNLLGSHQLGGECALHPAQISLFGERYDYNWNSRYTMALRSMVLKEGNTDFTLKENDKEQMVACRNIDGLYTVIVSTDLQRVGQAAGVISMQMPLIATLVLLVGLWGAYAFSRWFAKPLLELSAAARAMANGNYTVRVQKCSEDEIGLLAEDFNSMAAEVGRTAQLQRDLIANISHDLRTPLTLIKGYAETVRDLTGDDKKKRDEQLGVIVNEADRLSALVGSVMELSKYSTGSEKLHKVKFDLAQLCDEVAFRYTDTCDKNGYTLEVEATTPCFVYADPDMMSRVIHNLLANALHHVGADGWLGVRVVPQAAGKTRVEIADHGQGIAKEDLPYIFDKYYRTRASAGKVGTGLGLSITKAILLGHGFSFGVESEMGTGSTFWFET